MVAIGTVTGFSILSHVWTGRWGNGLFDDGRRSVSYPLCRHILCKLGAVAFFATVNLELRIFLVVTNDVDLMN